MAPVQGAILVSVLGSPGCLWTRFYDQHNCFGYLGLKWSALHMTCCQQSKSPGHMKDTPGCASSGTSFAASRNKQRCLLLPPRNINFTPFDATPLAGITPTLMANRQWAVNPPSLAISVAARLMVWMHIWCIWCGQQSSLERDTPVLKFIADVWKFGILLSFWRAGPTVYMLLLFVHRYGFNCSIPE